MALSKGAMMLLMLAYLMVTIHQVSCNCADVRFSSNQYLVLFENHGTVNLCVESLAQEQLRVFLLFRTSLRYKEDIDFPLQNFTADPLFNFTLQQEERCFEIRIIDDNITEEENKNFEFTLGVYNTEPNYCDNGLILIQDNDNVFFSGFGQFSNVKEDIGSVTPCVLSRAEVELSAFIYSYDFGVPNSEDVAFSDHNFTADPYFNFTIQPGETRCFEIFIIDDNLAEIEFENLFYDIGIYTPTPLHAGTGRITIQDDEGIRFGEVQVFVGEEVGTKNICVTYKGDNVPQTLAVRINLRSNSFFLVNSYGQGDLLFPPRNITITNGDRRCFDVEIIDDDLSEGTEIFPVDIALRNGSYHPYYSDSIQIHVLDNDGDETLLRIGFDMTAYSVLESAGQLDVCVSAYGGVGNEVFNVLIYFQDGTAQGAADYVESSQFLSLSTVNNTRCTTINITDDSEGEGTEYFEMVLISYNHISGNYGRFGFFNATTNVSIFDDDALLLECEVDGSGDHVVVDCQTNRPPAYILCSFDEGPKHTCSYPLAINLRVSPPGNHSLRIIIEDDEGFTAEDTVPYFLRTGSAPTVPVQVPPLTVHFINDSPRVMGNSVEADIVLSRPVQSLVCYLKSESTSVSISTDCSDERIRLHDLEAGSYVLRVVATNQVPDKELTRRTFEISNDPKRCSTHLINNGATVADNNVTVEFAGNGPARGYKCRLDRNNFYDCSSPVIMSGLAVGNHQLRVVPVGCGRNRKILKVYFIAMEF